MKKMTIIYPPGANENSLFYYTIPQQSFYLLDMAKCSIAESRNVLDEAELVIVFLTQDETDFQNFFERFSSLIPKTIFVIVDYQRNSGYSFRRLKEKYRINRDNIGVIPKNRNFYRACEEGNLKQFIVNAGYGMNAEYDSNFIAAIKKIAKKIHIRGVCLCTKEYKNE